MTNEISNETTSLRERVERVVDEVIEGKEGLFVVEVDLRGQKGSRVVDVFLDSEQGVDAEVLASVSREIGFVLETEDVIAGRYHLNVSSPGAERPLQHPVQFRKHIGRPLEIVLKKENEEAGETILGDLLEVTDDGLVLSAGPAETVNVTFSDIDTARVQLPW